jgi:hypothetical protein
MAELAAIGSADCSLCHQPMYAWMGRALHLHHSDESSALLGLPGDVLVHGKCNVSEGGKLGAKLTNGTAPKARTRAWSDEPREVGIARNRMAMLSDRDRCETCKDAAGRLGAMPSRCWFGNCTRATPRVTASLPGV